MDQVIQVFGSLLILGAFVAAQRNVLSQDSAVYLLLNLVGSVVLGVLAARERQAGFLLLEVAWGLTSAWSLVKLARASRQTPVAEEGP